MTSASQIATTFLLPLVSSVFLTLLVMPAVVRLAERVGAVDHPDERKVHVNVVPRMGGLAFLVSLLLIPFTMLDVSTTTQGFLLGLFIIGFTGMADDIFQISPRLKFLGIIAGCGMFLVMSGTAITDLGNLFGSGHIETGWFAIPLTLIAMVGFVNALNLSDGLDGLAAGITLIASFFLGSFALIIGDDESLMIDVVLFGSMVGFLYFNSHPARIFMGDTGSLILGYVLACLSLMLLQSGRGEVISPISMGILLGLPLSDTIYVMVRRILRGTSPFLPDKTHFHHRLIDLGLPHPGVVGVFYGLIYIYGCMAVLFAGTAEWLQSLVLAGLIATTYLVLMNLERFGFSLSLNADLEDSDSSGKQETSFYYMMTRTLGASIPLMTWVMPLILLPPVLSLSILAGNNLFMITVMVLAVLLYPWREGGRDSAWSLGLLYLLVFAIIFEINRSEYAWVHYYMYVMTALLFCWVVLKLWFKRHARIFLTSGFEILLLLFSWLTPWITGRFNLLSADIQAIFYLVCVEAVVFLLATKVVLRRQPRRNRQLLFSLLLLAGLTLL
ncbi:glycosyltransferase family 4 protein [Mariprofundus ferrooxydans]|uniref:UDP-N-acetylmuramyl pentapeptide phosphotransferase/UDP-N-acetylglucosamine-1-phosphate transferase-like protein n=1 Tax=Mariprofundus ferrooxydans PV-1 TaxID=314345 RepID=Q0EXY1_9PROT|nr:MraY family glycosyltransferase [Mariprofundus ferrooxydans]EAU54071.1 UDP-N-acetylmuramyl pentapeptide phosphotransferase/UDP-N- acetylglucosamine-1-phosphate transferase-like protein [Mariprofundus ferrooxydans PV-1]